MSSKGWGRAVALAVVAIASAIAYRWWMSDERAIRNQMSAVAESLTVQINERELTRMTRIASLRKALAADIQVVGGASAAAPGNMPVPQALVSRDAVLALLGRWNPAGGATVEFVDVQVSVDDDRAEATVYCTGKITSAPPGQSTIDARELIVAFAKPEGEWVVTSVRVEETLTGVISPSANP